MAIRKKAQIRRVKRVRRGGVAGKRVTRRTTARRGVARRGIARRRLARR
ncbi:MAG: hypothetical protein JST54_06195 [Deltaproteobacteria bacterium]|nr:hypothetical protein [Deltaproteobacteria bacterium]